MPNINRYGFRWHKSLVGVAHPEPLRGWIATGANFAINGVGNVQLGPGDVITRVSGGSVQICDGSEGAGGGVAVLGIVCDVLPYFDATLQQKVKRGTLPSGVAWGTNQSRKSQVLYWPAQWAQWEVDGDDATNATLAAWDEDIEENFDHINTGTVVGGRAFPKLDVSSHGTATAQWRLKQVSLSEENQDVTSAGYKLIVEVNEGIGGMYSATGI